MSQEELADISEHSSGIREELRRLRRECFICKIKYNMAGHGLIPCPAIIINIRKNIHDWSCRIMLRKELTIQQPVLRT